VARDDMDLLCGAITATLQRREKVDFSEPFFMTGMTALLRVSGSQDLRELFSGGRETSPPRSRELTPFAVPRIGVRAGTTTEAILRGALQNGGYKAEIIDFPGHAEGLSAMESGAIDAYFADRGLLIGLMTSAKDPSKLVVGSRLLSREPYGIALKRGDADFRLLVDRALSRVYQTQQFGGLLSKYFGSEAPVVAAQLFVLSLPD
jgi:ABC-type amino acid transport substrate-binding protein